jgi:hypothetical protein
MPPGHIAETIVGVEEKEEMGSPASDDEHEVTSSEVLSCPLKSAVVCLKVYSL